MKMYVGNLSANVSEQDLRELFAEFGEILSVNLITDRATGVSRGFGFVEMPDAAAQKAIEDCNERELKGNTITVNQAREREERRPSGGGGGGGGGYRGPGRSGGKPGRGGGKRSDW